MATAIVIIGKNAYHRANTTHLLPGSPLPNDLAGFAGGPRSACRQFRDQELFIGVVRDHDYEYVDDFLQFSTNLLGPET